MRDKGRRKYLTAAALMAAAGITVCGAAFAGECAGGTEVPGTESSTEAETDAGQIEEAKAMDTSRIADASDLAGTQEVGEEGAEPVTADQLTDGSYDLHVGSSSSMFVIDQATLTVDDGSMYVDMKLDGTGYLFLYPGTPEEAAGADAEDFIYYTEAEDGKYVYMHFPLEALDSPVPCAAFSKRKEQWYPRTLFFDSASLDDSAFAEETGKDAASLGFEDGEYSAAYSFSARDGGSAPKIASMTLTVTGGAVTARMVMEKARYDYIRIDGIQYDTAEEGSVFEFPVSVLDAPIALTIDSTAVAGKHVEKDCTLIFDSASVQKKG